MSVHTPSYTRADPAQHHFQYLEDLATGYWYSESLFAAVELRLFHHIETASLDTEGLAQVAGCRLSPLGRLLEALAQMELVGFSGGRWYNNPVARKYLLPDQSDYMGDFLLYRRYLQPRWHDLALNVTEKESRLSRLSPDDDYERRNLHYVRAVDALARLKSRQIADLLAGVSWSGPVLDVGAGAGSLSRSLMKHRKNATAVLLDLPEVLAAARRLYPTDAQWRGLLPVACDFRHAAPFSAETRFGLVLLSNFLHAYGPVAAEQLLARAKDLMQPDGLIVIHDYFPDVAAGPSRKGGLYDVNMMLNTQDGVCHKSDTVVDWLSALGLGAARVIPLPSDSAVILAGQAALSLPAGTRQKAIMQKAVEIGFQKTIPLDPEQIETAPWVQMKCRHGCPHYGRSLQCPPHTDTAEQTGQLLKSYTKALLLVGQPPANKFHNQLLKLEKTAFLDGFHKALAFGAGHCTVCDRCDTEAPCRFPGQARPSMEASGMDVFETARRCGVNLEPVTARDGYVKFIGLLLLE